MTWGSRKQDVTRTGSPEYVKAQQDHVIKVLKAKLAEAGLVEVEELTDLTDVDGRTCREIVADNRTQPEGVIIGSAHGYKYAEYREEAEAVAGRMRAAGQSQIDSANGILEATKHLPRKQETLFG